MQLLPQEVEVWYILPALRKELTKAFVRKGKKQKEVAMLLNITQAAVSQYVKDKRGAEVDFPPVIQTEIEKSALHIMESPESYLLELMRLSNILKESKLICDIHKHCDAKVDGSCDICFDQVSVEQK